MKTKVLTILGYVALVAVLLLMSQCEGGVKLTTVKKDAKHIIALAEDVESEEELKSVEKLARKYEISYERMYNGASALEFKRLTNDALREAGERCEAIDVENKRIEQMRDEMYGSLSDLSAAWRRNTSAKSEDMALIEKNELRIKKIEAKIKQCNKEIQDYADKLIEAGFPEDMLAKLGEMREQVTKYESMVQAVENENRIIRLAYKLQGVDFQAGEPKVEVVEPEVVEPEVEELATEEPESAE